MRWLLLVVFALGGCATEAPDRPARSSRTSHKPTAPVELAIDTVASARGFEVTLRATPTRDVDAVELRLGNHSRGFGATKAGVTRVVSASVAPGEVIGEARVAGRSKAIVAHVGVPAPQPQLRPTRRVTLPGGIDVAEVRQ